MLPWWRFRTLNLLGLEATGEWTLCLLILEDLCEYRLELGDLLLVFVCVIRELHSVVGVLSDAQDKHGLVVDAPALRSGKDGVQEVAGVEEGDVGRGHAVDAQGAWPRVSSRHVQSRHPNQCYIPTARVRSVGVLHAIEGDASLPALAPRDGESRREVEVVAVVKDTILAMEQMNRVSMSFALLEGAGDRTGRLAMREGRVKLRRELSGCSARRGASSEGAGDDMTGASRVHRGEKHRRGRSAREGIVQRLQCVGVVVTALGVGSRLRVRRGHGLAKRVEFHTDQRICS